MQVNLHQKNNFTSMCVTQSPDGVIGLRRGIYLLPVALRSAQRRARSSACSWFAPIKITASSGFWLSLFWSHATQCEPLNSLRMSNVSLASAHIIYSGPPLSMINCNLNEPEGTSCCIGLDYEAA